MCPSTTYAYNPYQMDHLAVRKIRRILLWASTGVLAFGALFSPALGPVMDHHFPERHHNHAHIYLRPPDADHIHPYQNHHSHRRTEWGKYTDGPSALNVPIDTVYLAPLDGLGQDSLTPLTPSTQPAKSFPDQGDPSYMLTWPQRYDPLREVFVPPPKLPPRVAPVRFSGLSC